MRPSTRRVLIAAGVAAIAMLAGVAHAATGFPAKDIAFIIPDGPGGGFDLDVRAIAPAMEKYLPSKVNIVPTNVPGAAGTRAAIEIYRAKPDGYTIGIFNIPGIYLQQQRGGAGFDLTRLSWLGRVGIDNYGLAVGESSPIRSVADLQALSQTRPVKFTSTGPAGTAYNATLIAANLLDIKAQLITGYRGSSDYVVGAIRGDGDAVITVIPTLRRMAEGKTLRIIADFEERASVSGAEDAVALGKPELAQIVLDRLIAAPPGLPEEIRAILAGALVRALADSQVIAWAKETDSTISPESSDQAAATLRSQIEFYDKWKPFLNPKR